MTGARGTVQALVAIVGRELGPAECVWLLGLGLVFYGLTMLASAATACVVVGAVLLRIAWPAAGPGDPTNRRVG